MNLKKYLKTWEGTQTENKWGRIFQGGLIAIVFLLVVQVFSKETIVTIQPFTLTEEAWVTKSNASQSYKEAWGFAFAQLLGNVTPGTVDFVKERITPLLSPSIYQDVIDAIEIQAQQIKNDRVTMRFEPRFVEYEPKSDKVFVYGYSYVKGASSNEERSETLLRVRHQDFKLRARAGLHRHLCRKATHQNCFGATPAQRRKPEKA